MPEILIPGNKFLKGPSVVQMSLEGVTELTIEVPFEDGKMEKILQEGGAKINYLNHAQLLKCNL